jgi:hypothetical protein
MQQAAAAEHDAADERNRHQRRGGERDALTQQRAT